MVGAIGTQYVAGAGSLAGSSLRLSSVAARGFDRFGAALLSGLSFVTENLGLGRLVSADEQVSKESDPNAAPTRPAAPTAKPAPPAATHAATTASASHPAAAPERPRIDPAPAVKVADRASTPQIEIPVTVPFAAFDLEPAATSAAPHRTADETIFVPIGRSDGDDEGGEPIYTAGTESVIAPVAVRPQLPRELPPNVSRADLRLIELVISPRGTVESVRLVGTPRNVHDSMLLSACKAWEFVPALKNGVPVRYRKLITVAPRL
jgi:hypothetical protein